MPDITNAVGQNYVAYTNTNITEVERVNQQKIYYVRQAHHLTAPTTQFPAYVLGGATIVM